MKFKVTIDNTEYFEEAELPHEAAAKAFEKHPTPMGQVKELIIELLEAEA